MEAIGNFEMACAALGHHYCISCHTVSINNEINKKGFCTRCILHRDKDYYLKHKSLLVWYNENGTVRYNLPEQLEGLSQAKMMLIQRISPFVPLHISRMDSWV